VGAYRGGRPPTACYKLLLIYSLTTTIEIIEILREINNPKQFFHQRCLFYIPAKFRKIERKGAEIHIPFSKNLA